MVSQDNQKLRQETVDTYNNSAKALAEYFQGIGPRVGDIKEAFKLAGEPINSCVVEIGCGDGRDAKEITKRTNNYQGFDISEGMVAIARQQLPGIHFDVADALSYNYPSGIDIVFAFASLLHLNREELNKALQMVAAKLKPGGIFYISLKYAPQYTEFVKEDKYGRRLFFLYTPKDIEQLAATAYATARLDQKTIGQTEWFEIALRKV